MSEHSFPPISDKIHFPILTALNDQPCSTLMSCEELAFWAPQHISDSYAVIGKEGVDWHLYGDTTWPSRSVWVEFPLNHRDFNGNCGVLVLNARIPNGESDIFDWVARNAPLLQIFPAEKADGVIRQRLEMMRTQSASHESVPGPDDSTPKSIQCYCIYKSQYPGNIEFIATYTDLLNAVGIPIQRYRMASVESQNVVYCRFALHALFRLNEARLSGMAFLTVNQLKTFAPVYLLPEQNNPKWAQFHPSRTLRARPAIRALPTPTKIMNGIMHLDDFQHVLDVCRREVNAHMLAFDINARPRDTTLQQRDANSSIAAFSHRTNGGAIYVLPNRLVEEFDNTDCGEVRVGDITLPFLNIFLKFTPPQPIFLADGAQVDGCYVVKQGDEYLFSLTSCLEHVDYQQSISLTCCDPTFSLHLPASEADLCINAAVERGVNDYLKSNAPPDEDLSKTVKNADGTVSQLVDVRAESRKRRIEIFKSQEPVFRACLNIIVNAACFIAFRPDDICDGWEGEPSSDLIEAANDPGIYRRGRDRKREALKKIDSGDYTRIKICGRDLFSDDLIEGKKGKGVSPRAHWRRGHWRRQRYGTGLSLVVLRWIRPTIVMMENGPLVEGRIYDVQKPTSQA